MVGGVNFSSFLIVVNDRRFRYVQGWLGLKDCLEDLPKDLQSNQRRVRTRNRTVKFTRLVVRKLTAVL